MKKKAIITILIIVILGAGVIGLRFLTNSSTAIEPSQTNQIENSNNLKISQDGKIVAYDGIVGETALATLKKLTQVQTEVSDFGEYVTSINGLAANSNSNEFWAFYVNGQQAPVGAGSYNSVAGDKIEWKLESF